jgi:flagellar biosynthesis/type III secretory pathway protein FliH
MYVNHLVNRFQETGENNLNLAVLQQIVINTAQEVIGKEESVLRNGWFDEECAEATENKNEACNKTVQRCETRGAEERYKEMRKVKKRIHRKKKKEY